MIQKNYCEMEIGKELVTLKRCYGNSKGIIVHLQW